MWQDLALALDARSRTPHSVRSKIFCSCVMGLICAVNCGTVLTAGDWFYRALGLSARWAGGRGLLWLVSLWLGAMVAILVYLAVLPCIIRSQPPTL